MSTLFRRSFNFDEALDIGRVVSAGVLPKQRFFRDGAYWFVKMSTYNMPNIDGTRLDSAFESYSEVMCSKILKTLGLDVVEYELCNICSAQKWHTGCCSESFKVEGSETFRTMFDFLRYDEKLHRWLGRDLEIYDMLETRNFEYVCRTLQKRTGLDWFEICFESIVADFLTGNGDRHLQNLGCIERADGTFRKAPLFDNGDGLFGSVTEDLIYWDNYEVLCNMVTTSPFTPDPYEQISLVDKKYLKSLVPGIRTVRDSFDEWMDEWEFDLSETRKELIMEFVDTRCNEILEVFPSD